MNQRPYTRENDIHLLQAFNAAAIAESAGCGFVHPGDIPHRLFNGNKLYDPAEVLTIWEDSRGVAAWVLIGPRYRGYDAQVRPDLRGESFEREVLEFADQHTVTLMRRFGIEGDRLEGLVYRCDRQRIDLQTDMGWVPNDDEPPWVLNHRVLDNLPEPRLPTGYRIRSVTGVEEAGSVADVHSASFGSSWTTEQYRKVMESPGYAAEHEYVVEAPDGTLAAFTVTWHDPWNHTGLFEPVGVHHRHRRLGLGKALLQYAMLRMAGAGMTSAEVVNEGTNEAARRLYQACGFKPRFELDEYVLEIK